MTLDDSSTEALTEAEVEELSRNIELEARRLITFKSRSQHAISSNLQGAPAVLHTLVKDGGVASPGELARECHLSDARVANILRALEERGYVERRPSAHDRRRVEVILTEMGRELHRDRFTMVRTMFARLITELGREDAAELARIMAKANGIIERMIEDDSLCPCNHAAKGADAESENQKKGNRA